MGFVDWAGLDFSSNSHPVAPQWLNNVSDDLCTETLMISLVWKFMIILKCLIIARDHFSLSDSYQQHDKPLCRITTSHVIQSLSTL